MGRGTTLLMTGAVLAAAAGSAWAQAARSAKSADGNSPAILLEKGLYAEQTVGDLDAAIKVYRQILDQAKADRKFAAQAQYRLAMCLLKKGDKPAAERNLRELLATYPQEKQVAAQAREELAKMLPLADRIAVLRKSGTTVKDVMAALGEPEKYVWGRQTLAKDKLPTTYILQYPRGLHVVIARGLAMEFRSERPGPGLTYRDRLKLGSSLADVLAVLGEPTRTVRGEPIGFVSGVLYEDIDGRKGFSYYSRADQLVRVFLAGGKVTALYLTCEDFAQDYLPGDAAAPRVVRTTPAAFADNVDPSLAAITVTFDRPMLDKSWSWTAGDKAFSDKTGSQFPQRAGSIFYDANRTTCTMPVKLEPGKVYWVGINGPSFQDFRTPEGVPAGRYQILFATRTADGKPTPLPAELVRQAQAINVGTAKSGHPWLAAAQQRAEGFVDLLRQGRTDDAYKGTSEEYRKGHKNLDKFAQAVDFGKAQVVEVLAGESAACAIVSPITAKANGKTASLGLGLVRFGEGYLVRDLDILPDAKMVGAFVEGFQRANPGFAGPMWPADSEKAKLINWVERFFSENYRDITARKTLAWGTVEKTESGNLAIRYRFLATIWHKDKLVIEKRFTFTPEGKYVSAETLEKAPAVEPSAVPSARGVAEDFLSAVAAGDTRKALTFVAAGSAVGHQLEDFAKIPDLAKATIAGTFGDADAALVITSEVAADHERKGPLLIRLAQQRGLWVVTDVDAESADGAQKELSDFLAKSDGLAAPYAIARAFVGALGKKDTDSALKLVGENFEERKKAELAEIVEGMALSGLRPVAMALYASSARAVYWPASVAATSKKFYLCLTLTQLGAGAGTWVVSNADFVEDQKDAERFISPPQPEPPKADRMAAEELTAQGWSLWQARRLSDAEAKFQAATVKDPRNAEAWNGLGWSRFNQGQHAGAKEAFDKCIAILPNHPAALNGLGWVARSEGNVEEAIRCWQQAVAAVPGTTAAWSGLATTYAEVGRYDLAASAYQKWLEVEPNSAEAKSGLAKVAQDDKALLGGAGNWLGLLDAGEYRKAWETAGPLLRTAVDDPNQWAKVMTTVRETLGTLKTRKLSTRQYAATIPGLAGGPFLVLRYDTEFQKKHVFENVVLQRDKLGTWGVVGYTIAPYSEEMIVTGAASATTIQPGDVPKDASAAAGAWLKRIDEGDYAKTYEQAAKVFRQNVAKDEWARMAAAARSPLGKVKTRTLLSAASISPKPDAPPSPDTLVLQYRTAFEKRDQAVETVSLVKESDGKWRVQGYFIR